MKVRLLHLCLLVSALALTVQSKPHGKHESHHKHTQPAKEKDLSPVLHDGDEAILPTFFPFEASSPEPEDEDLNEGTSNDKEKSEQVDTGTPEASDGDMSNIPVLLSEEALTKLLQASEEEQQTMEEDKEDEDVGKEGEVDEVTKESMEVREESKAENGKGAAREQQQQQKEKVEVEELGSSTDSEIPMDLDYAADSETIDPAPSQLEEAKPSISNKEKVEDELPTAMEDYDSQQLSEDAEKAKEENQEEQADQSLAIDEQKEPLQDTENVQNYTDDDKDKESKEAQLQDEKNSVEPADNNLPDEKEVEKHTNESDSHAKGKGKKQKRLRKMQRDQPSMAEGPTEHTQNEKKEPESTLGTLQKTKRRKNGKWPSLVGINPVQIRAAVELFPKPVVRSRLGADGQEAPVDPCENFHCKRGKTCKLNEEQKPTCVCQQPADCPPSVAEFEHVCGTDNQTYDTSCQLFATKCGLEGTKKGHRLHLDYTGSCKFIPPCLNTELVQFPLRMRDWLKNVLLQLYEHDSVTPGFLTAKQRARVQKLYESERRLHAGDHSIELLAQDFEKNYPMYIYPVHWQFAQMDQHPSDRFLSHSELAPLRVPLVPMEHCTSVFFQECDADKDKLVSFREWCQCFGIKDEDMDTKLLF
ncbi:SPARC-like protein 1 [Colossoma macropomum]|uniref:SPARC-like protein 1 n=1 Tax=Colossoma macropomum TaxID=42526 RepID=UPI001864E1F1|nr:SPARC-like protein 1 [Colossoma macropomum]